MASELQAPSSTHNANETLLMGFLVHPPCSTDEGSSGYRLRLATANRLSYRHLIDLELTGEAGQLFPHSSDLQSDPGCFDPWVRRFSRFCPHCLSMRKKWLLGWEILFVDVCPACGRWLIDTCSQCGERLSWNRHDLLRCNCGQSLTLEVSNTAPSAMFCLSRSLQCVALGLPPTEIPILNGLNLGQCGRLIRLLGTYGNADGRAMPQKVSQVDTLPVSWPIVSIAAEILNSWPTGISSFLKRLHAQGCVDQKGKLPKAFGGFYSALYRGFKEVEFDFLRTAFENYVAEHWAGAIGKRNRRLDIRVLNSLAWIPANHACQILGVSRRRLNGLIEKERLQADRRITAGNRIFIVVKRSEVQNLALTLDDGVPLSDVARRLGFKKQRLLSLLPIICPQAEKLGEQGCPWAIPITWLEGWEAQIQSYTCVALVDSESVSLGHLLRYWPWTDGQIGHLLTDILNSKIVPVGRLESINGIGSLILETSQLKTWFSGKQKVPCSELTIPEVSLRIGVKQEVAYALVRIGLLQTAMRKIGRRTEQRVPTDALKNFERQYVFGRDIAQTLGRSSRSITAFLASEGVEPIAGPAINKCRQILFERDSVSRCLFRNGLTAVELVAPLPVTGEGR